MANDCKYQRKQYQISYDSGSTWHNAVPARYEKGELTEYSSPDCSGIEVQYRWRELEGQYICIDSNKYTKEILEESYDNGATWYVSYPTTYKEGYFVEYNEEYCSFKFKGHYYSSYDSSHCPPYHYWNGYECSTRKIDPLKVVRCNNDSTLTKNETAYYISYFSIFKAEIGSCVKTLSNNLFSGTTSLTSVTMDSGVESIGSSAFHYCTGLTSIGPVGSGASVEIPNTLKTIGSSAFTTCHGLTSVTIPDSVRTIGDWGFARCTRLKSCTIGSGVTYINNSAFTECYNLSTVRITNGPKIIGGNTFRRCTSLISIGPVGSGASVEIPNSVTTIGVNAFTLSGLRNITIPGNVKNIERFAFYLCGSLSSCTIENGVTTIGERAFRDCSNLTSVTVNATTPPSLVGSYVFENTPIESGTGKIYVPCGCKAAYQYASGWRNYANRIYVKPPCEDPIMIQLTYIDGNNYEDYCGAETGITRSDTHPTGYQASAMTSAVIGDCITNIGPGSFSACTSLSSVTIGSGVTSINKQAFDGCRSLTSITIKATTPPGLGTNALRNTSGYIYVPCGSVDTYRTNWSDYYLRIKGIPDSGCQYKYTSTYSNGYTYEIYCNGDNYLSKAEARSASSHGVYGSMINAVIGDCVTSFENNCFEYLRKLTSCTIGNSVTSIPFAAFYTCTGLTSCTLGSGVTTIGDSAFRLCTSLTSIGPVGSGASVEIPSGVTSIDAQAFRQCTSLTGITIPSGITTIGEYAFSDCTNLTSLEIQNGAIGSSAFRDCTGLTSVSIGSGVTSIGGTAFYNCSSLSSATIPDTITNIETGAFYGCSLTSITIPNSVVSIGQNAFYDCYVQSSNFINNSSLDEVANIYWGAIVYDYIVDDMYIRDNSVVKYVGNSSAVTIPDSITSIGWGAFSGLTSLSSVTIGSGVTIFDKFAFYNCTSLTSMTINATTPPTLLQSALQNTNDCPIYVPAASVDSYKTSWWYLESRIQAIP